MLLSLEFHFCLVTINSGVLLGLNPLEDVTAKNRLYVDSWSSPISGSARVEPQELSGKWRRQGPCPQGNYPLEGTHPGQRRRKDSDPRSKARKLSNPEQELNIIKSERI